MSNWQKQAADEQLEKCRKELWLALGYGPEWEKVPSGNWEGALRTVKDQTEALARIRGIVRNV